MNISSFNYLKKPFAGSEGDRGGGLQDVPEIELGCQPWPIRKLCRQKKNGADKSQPVPGANKKRRGYNWGFHLRGGDAVGGEDEYVVSQAHTHFLFMDPHGRTLSILAFICAR